MPRKLSPDKLVLRLLETTLAPVYLIDSERRVAYANLACEQWTGLTTEQLLGWPCEFRQPEGDAPPTIDLSLAPPAEVFAGEPTSGYVAAATDGGKVRLAHFEPFPTERSDLPPFVLAVVSGPPIVPAELEADSVLPSDARRLHAQLLELRAAWKRSFKASPFIGISPAAQRIRSQIRLAASGSAGRVLVVGPPGSGREHIVRAIHFNQLGEPGPLVSIACRLLDTERMQQTLATFLKTHPASNLENAAMLLSDVDELPPAAQHELAEFLRLPGIDLTIRATARRSLDRLARQGRFHADLAHALGTLTITVPALKDRQDDIPLLAQHFVETATPTHGRKFTGFSVDALDELATYAWPGEVAELAEVVRDCCEQALGPYITPVDLPERFRHARAAAAHPSRVPEPIQLDELLAGVEREVLQRALAASKGNKTKAASLLGIHRARLIRRLIQLGLAEPPTTTEEAVIFEPHPDETN